MGLVQSVKEPEEAKKTGMFEFALCLTAELVHGFPALSAPGAQAFRPNTGSNSWLSALQAFKLQYWPS